MGSFIVKKPTCFEDIYDEDSVTCEWRCKGCDNVLPLTPEYEETFSLHCDNCGAPMVLCAVQTDEPSLEMISRSRHLSTRNPATRKRFVENISGIDDQESLDISTDSFNPGRAVLVSALSLRFKAQIGDFDRCYACDQIIPPEDATPLEKAHIGVSVHPDKIRAWFWGLMTLMLSTGAVISSYSDNVDWDNNPIKDTFGVNNPCLYLDYVPSKQVVCFLFVICLIVWAFYNCIRWAQAVMARNAGIFSPCTYYIYVTMILIQIAVMCFFTNVFAVGPDEDVKWHTIPFTAITAAVVLDIMTNLFWAWKVCKMEPYLLYSGLFYLFIVMILSAIKMHKEIACIFSLKFGCEVGDTTGNIPLEVQITWVFMVMPMEMCLSLVKQDVAPNLHFKMRIPVDTARSAQNRKYVGWFDTFKDNPLFFWPPFLMLFGLMLLKVDRPNCFDVDTKLPGDVAIRFFYMCTHLALNFIGSIIYRRSAFCCMRCCCTRRGLNPSFKPYELDVEKEDLRSLLDHNSDRHTTYTRELLDLSEKDRDFVDKYENYIWKPLFLSTFIVHALNTNARLNSDFNEWGSPFSMILCTIAQVWTAVYMISWIRFCRETRKYPWSHPKIAIVLVMLLWVPCVGLSRLCVWWFGRNFTEVVFGRTCGYRWINL